MSKKVNGVMFQKGNKAAEKWTEDRAVQFGKDMLNWMLISNDNIFFEEFLFMVAPFMDEYSDCSINVNTPNYLATKYPSFLELHENARKFQEIKLKKGGSFDKLNASIVRFLLSAEHGLSEKSILESNNTTDINISPKTLDDWYNKNRDVKDE